MEVFANLYLGLQTAASFINLAYCFIGVLLGTADRRAAGLRAGGDHRHAAADHLRPAAGRRR